MISDHDHGDPTPAEGTGRDGVAELQGRLSGDQTHCVPVGDCGGSVRDRDSFVGIKSIVYMWSE